MYYQKLHDCDNYLGVVVKHFVLEHRMSGQLVYVKTLMSSINTIKQELITSGENESSHADLFNLRRIWKPLYFLEFLLNIFLIVLRFKRKDKKYRLVFDVHGVQNLAPLVAARIIRANVVWHIHESYSKYKIYARIGRIFLNKKKSKIVVVADKAGSNYGFSSYQVINSPINTNFWRVRHKRYLPFNEGYKLNILCVGNLNPLKGQDILLKALLNVDFPFCLNLVGAELDTQKEYNKSLNLFTKELLDKNRSANVVYHGAKSSIEVRELMKKCDVYVQPSRSEACPIALLEAMAMRCVCVASNVGGVSEIASSKNIIILTEPKADMLSVSFSNVYRISEFERMSMGENARNVVSQRFSKELIAKQHINVYESF